MTYNLQQQYKKKFLFFISFVFIIIIFLLIMPIGVILCVLFDHVKPCLQFSYSTWDGQTETNTNEIASIFDIYTTVHLGHYEKDS